MADQVEDALFAAANMLGEFPELGAITDEANVQRWPMTSFRYTMFYVIDEKKGAIDVLRIIDARRVRDLKRTP